MSSKSKGARAVARRRLGPVLTHGASALLLAATLFPVLWLVQMSFKTDVEAMRVPPTVFFAPRSTTTRQSSRASSPDRSSIASWSAY